MDTCKPHGHASTFKGSCDQQGGSETTSCDVVITQNDSSMQATTITPEGQPRATVSEVNASCLTSVPDIAKEALRITKEKLGSNYQLVPRDPANKKHPLPTTGIRLNKFVRRLHDMLKAEQSSGIVEWRKGLLVLHSTSAFAKQILPKYFNTRNFKTFRRQLNYYGFVHVRSFSTTGSTTTALWVNQTLAESGNADIKSVLMLKRVEPCDGQKTAEGRRVRKELAIHTVEEDLGVNTKTLQLEQIRSLALRGTKGPITSSSTVPTEVSVHSSDVTRSGSISSYSSGSDEPTQVSSDEDNGAANLLLMLSQTG